MSGPDTDWTASLSGANLHVHVVCAHASAVSSGFGHKALRSISIPESRWDARSGYRLAEEMVVGNGAIWS